MIVIGQVAFLLCISFSFTHINGEDVFQCADDPNFEVEYFREKMISCEHIRADESMKLLLCNQKPVREACMKTCEYCCHDDETFKFLDGRGVKRRCAYISRDEWRLRKFCNVQIEDGSDKVVGDMCPKACNICTPDEPTYQNCVDNPYQCKEIASSEEDRQRLCENHIIREQCPHTCGMCCVDDVYYAFPLDRVKNRSVKCDWISRNRKKKDIRRERYCNRTLNGHLVREKCPEACNSCFEEVQFWRTDAPSSSPTISQHPTSSPTISYFPTVSFSPTATSWSQLGSTIVGSDLDRFGRSVAISSSGTIVAVAARAKAASDVSSLIIVKVFEFDGTDWNQKGNDIPGQIAQDISTVCLSSNGLILAIGAPSDLRDEIGTSGYVQVYQFDDGVWNQLGQNLGHEDGDEYPYVGSSISLSSDGLTIAISDMKYRGRIFYGGRVRVYQYDATQWTKRGKTIHGGEIYGGYSISLSGDGFTFAMGFQVASIGYGDDGYGQDWCEEGYVRVYQFDGTTWNTKGPDLSHWNEDESRPISLSGDGNVVALSEGYGKYYEIYKYDSTADSWVEILSGLRGHFGSLSSDGLSIAVSEANDNDKTGIAKVYKYDGTSWNQVGKELKGVEPDALFGSSMALSTDGNVLVVGAPYPSNGDNDGYVQVYYFRDF